MVLVCATLRRRNHEMAFEKVGRTYSRPTTGTGMPQKERFRRAPIRGVRRALSLWSKVAIAIVFTQENNVAVRRRTRRGIIGVFGVH